MNQPVDSQSEAHKPFAHSAEPDHVVIDDSLSSSQKADALDTLEQDHRQLLQAASEGMEGGESSKLHDVLGAKDALAASAVINAYETVLDDLRLRQTLKSEPAARALVDQAISALSKLTAPPKC
jgi:hypothetical protein